MYPVTDAYQSAIKSSSRTFQLKLFIKTAFEDYTLTDNDVVEGSLKLTSAAVSSDKFGLGAAVASDLRVTILNPDGRFDEVLFNGGIIQPEVGIELESGEFEHVPLGLFNIDSVSRPATTIELCAADNMLLLDQPFSKVNLAFDPSAPPTNLQILSAICFHCGVPLGTADFIHADYPVQTRPEDSKLTCRDVVQYIAVMAGGFARCNRSGHLEIVPFRSAEYVTEAEVDGNDGKADGGSFLLYKNKSIDGGAFFETVPEAELTAYNRYDFKMDDDPIEISGIIFEAEHQIYQVGSDRYALQIDGNPLMGGDPTDVLNVLADQLVGFKYLPFTSSWQGDPAIDPGDLIRQTDKNGVDYNTIVTNVSYAYRDAGTLAAKGVSEIANGFQSNSSKQLSQIIRKVHEKQVQINAMDQAIISATSLISMALGGYPIISPPGYEGSIFIADNPDITQAREVWRWNLGGFGYSDNGVDGPYEVAITKDKTIIANALMARIISGEMIKAGSITAENIAAGTITGDKISANSITGDKIQAGTISGDKLITETVEAVKLKTPGQNDFYMTVGAPEPDGSRAIYIYRNGESSPFFKIYSRVEDDYQACKIWTNAVKLSIASNNNSYDSIECDMDTTVLNAKYGSNSSSLQVKPEGFYFYKNNQLVHQI